MGLVEDIRDARLKAHLRSAGMETKIDDIPLAYREILGLHEKGYNFRQIAKRIGVSPKTVSNWAYRLRIVPTTKKEDDLE